jgi:LysM repeat protein
MSPIRRSLSFTVAVTISFGMFAAADVAHAERPAASPATYVVQPGDSLYGIAQRQGISVRSLLDANGLTIESVILPGQQLELPGVPAAPTANPASEPASEPAPSSVSHRVVPGDSLSGIASRYGIGLAALLRANSLRIDSVILPGQQLVVPGASTPAPAAAPGAPAASSPGDAGLVHKIVAGDSLSAIAGAYDVRLSALLAENGLSIDSVILPGRLLRLPAGATAPTTAIPATNAAPAASDQSTTTLRHTVAAGNSLSGIAATYGVRLADLLATNGLRIDSVILPGQVLELPAGASLPVAAAAAPAAEATSAGSAPSSGNTRIDAVVAFAQAQVGKDYAFFTKGPDAFDCSGLTLAAYAQAGIGLVHYSAAQALQGTRVDLDTDSIRAGDLIFQQRRGSTVINHVGIAIDAHRWVQAAGTGLGVRIGPIPDASTITEVRRYIDG